MPCGQESARELELVFDQMKQDKIAAKMKKKKVKQINSKQTQQILSDCAKKRFSDPRQISKFTEVSSKM